MKNGFAKSLTRTIKSYNNSHLLVHKQSYLSINQKNNFYFSQLIPSNKSNSNESDEQKEQLLSKQTNEISVLNELDKQNKEITDKYKIYIDSTKEVMEGLKEEVPEIKNHYEFTQYIKKVIDEERQDELLQKQGIVILKTKDNVMHKYRIDPHYYFKYLDRDYEVDIHNEQTKDLLEKQRVVDNYVENSKDEVQNLLGFWENRFKYTKHNKYKYLVYKNNYKMWDIQKVLFKNISVLLPLSLVFAAVNPFLLVFLAPDYFAVLKMMGILNQTVDEIYLNEDKVTFIARRFNFLGKH